jgi:hypothetical protein
MFGSNISVVPGESFIVASALATLCAVQKQNLGWIIAV